MSEEVPGSPEAGSQVARVTEEQLDEAGLALALRLDRMLFGLHPDEPEGFAHDTRRAYRRRLIARVPSGSRPVKGKIDAGHSDNNERMGL